jgi:hypothetical protein
MRFDEWSCMKLCSDCRTCGLCVVVAIDMKLGRKIIAVFVD